MTFVRTSLRWAALSLAAMAALASARAADVTRADGRPFQVFIATWRGCEEVCKAFEQYLVSRGLAVEFIERTADSQPANLPAMVAEARGLRPDLIATWGTGVTLAFTGAHGEVDPARHITDIPVVYLYVTDPVGAKIARAADRSGRPNVAGAHYAVPAEAQIRAMQSYRPVKAIGLVFGRDEANSVAAKDDMKAAAARLGVATVEAELPLGADGHPRKDDLPAAIQQLAAAKVDFIAFGSSSFLRTNLMTFTRMANAAGVPVFGSGESLLVEGDSLLGLNGPLRSIGQISAFQAYRILAEKAVPGDLETPRLTRFALTVKMPVARQLELYPPMTILRYAELMEK